LVEKQTDDRPAGALANASRSLTNRNFRRYLGGQWLSMMGMWMQSTAAAWLIYELTSSPMAIGLYSAISLGPVLAFGAYGGLLVDRLPRLRLLCITQSLLMLGAIGLVVITLMPRTPTSWVYAIGFFKGCVTAVDNPLRRAVVRELVTDEELPNAIALNSTAATVARTVGPALGGLTIAALGVTWNFGLNGLSYGAVLVSLAFIDRSRLRDTPPTPRGRRQIRAGLGYAIRNDRIWSILVIATVVGTFAWNYGVLMPVYATETFDGGPSMYGVLLATVGAGAFVGAILSARAEVRGQVEMIKTVGFVAAALFSIAAAPVVAVAILALFALGLSGTTVIIAAQTNLQLRVDDGMIGRILALYSIAFIGSKPFGGLLAGWLMQVSGPRLAFAVSAVLVALVAAGLGVHEYRSGQAAADRSTSLLETSG
jgi:predicted MFS family arabinose efflux permease